MTNKPLHQATKAKDDEFYTLYSDVESEVSHYLNNLKGKVVYSNCDNPLQSEFVKYFQKNYNNLGLSKYIATGLPGIKYLKSVSEEYYEQMVGGGSFDSDEALEILKESDVVITNPPFSLFRDYLKLLLDYGKKFLIIGCKTAIGYKDIFPLIKDNKMWLGCKSGNMTFKVPDDSDSTKTKFREDALRTKIKDTWKYSLVY